MEENVWISIVAVAVSVLVIEAALAFWRSRKFSGAQDLLIKAKQETMEIAQMSLHNPHPQIQVSERGKVIFANPAALKEFPGIEHQAVDHVILHGLAGAKSREVTYESKIYDQTIALTRVNGEIAYVVYCHDITERKSYESEIQAAREKAEYLRQEAEAAKEARGDFLANMSHELRTPMNGIIGLSDMLIDKGLRGEKQTMIEAVNSSARNLLILLNDILDFSKIEAGELTMENIPFDMRAVVKQIEFLQKPMASQKGLVMNSEIDANVPALLIGDPSRLQQILNNLISNALKFTEAGSVSLSVYGQEGQKGDFVTRIVVRDTGIGIAEDKQKTIFQKFQQADASTARKYGGTGLGLAITKDLVEMMGGTLEMDSKLGIGTTFTVTLSLPVSNKEVVGAAQEQIGVQGVINRAARILLVDDHPVNLLVLRQAMQKFGIENFDEASSGKQALSLFQKNKYDLIIMDCQMPEMDGYDAAMKIRECEDSASRPVILAATADAMKGAEEKCKAAGMDDYISKPIDWKKLQHMLQRWLPGTADKKEPAQEALPGTDETAEQTDKDRGAEIIDWDHLKMFTSDDPEFENEVIQVFVENLKTDITEMHKSLKARDYVGWDSWVHKLYGSSSNVGANALAAVCDEGQLLCEKQDIQKIHETHKHILIEYKRVCEYLAERQ